MSRQDAPRPTVDLGYPTEPHGRIPAFASIEEEAEFWDTHDHVTLEPLRPGDVADEPADREILTVRFDRGARGELDRRAEELGVDTATLVRMWIEERLHREAS